MAVSGTVIIQNREREYERLKPVNDDGFLSLRWSFDLYWATLPIANAMGYYLTLLRS
jgi:hypothetical protein